MSTQSKQVTESLKRLEHDMKTYADSQDLALHNNLAQELRFSIDKQKQEIKSWFDVEGIVDSTIEDPMEARH